MIKYVQNGKSFKNKTVKTTGNNFSSSSCSSGTSYDLSDGNIGTSSEENMEINSSLIIISEAISRTMSSATALLLCSRSVHLKPKESVFIS